MHPILTSGARLRRLFGRLFRTARADGDSEPVNGFLGTCVSSPNGRYTLGWDTTPAPVIRDADGVSPDPRYFLLDHGAVVTQGWMRRPGKGKVADNGTFILCDREPPGRELGGTFHAFRADGQLLLTRDFNAGLFSAGLARNGRHAACQTRHSPDRRDSGILAVFDLDRGVEVALWCPESGWASGYEFSEDGSSLSLSYPTGLCLRYTLTGELIDRQTWDDYRLTRGVGHALGSVPGQR